MQSSIRTMAFNGIDTIPVDVQVHLSNGMPSIAIVGLADKAVVESKERVRAALSSIGVAMPPKRIAINLAPADINKEGSHYDLPIALREKARRRRQRPVRARPRRSVRAATPWAPLKSSMGLRVLSPSLKAVATVDQRSTVARARPQARGGVLGLEGKDVALGAGEHLLRRVP